MPVRRRPEGVEFFQRWLEPVGLGRSDSALPGWYSPRLARLPEALGPGLSSSWDQGPGCAGFGKKTAEEPNLGPLAEKDQNSHHEPEKANGLGKRKPNDGVFKEHIMLGRIPGKPNNQSSKNYSSAGTRAHEGDGGQASSDEP